MDQLLDREMRVQTDVAVRSCAPTSARLVSLDAYRGFVILVMIWVNYIGEMPGVPTWLKHASASQDTFTLPDLVFPGFLFLAGIAIPLALDRHLVKSAPLGSVLFKIFWRAFSLIVAGIMLVNEYRYDTAAALLPRALYYALFYLAVILLWQQNGSSDRRFWFGVALMGFLILTFQGKTDAEFHRAHLEQSWWGILGLIGWAYACCSLIYLAARGNGTALMGVLAFMIALYMGGERGVLDFMPTWLYGLTGVGQLFGSTSANMLAGVLVGQQFVRNDSTQDTHALHAGRTRFMLFFAVGLVLVGLLLRPYHGINKINATESFTLVCAGINLFAFLVFYVVMDVLKWRVWAAVLIPVGTNALFAYILPDLWSQLLDLIGLQRIWMMIGWPYLEQGGGAGLLNAAAVSLLMVGLTALATRFGLRLKF